MRVNLTSQSEEALLFQLKLRLEQKKKAETEAMLRHHRSYILRRQIMNNRTNERKFVVYSIFYGLEMSE